MYHVLIYGLKITAASRGFPATARLSCLKLFLKLNFFIIGLKKKQLYIIDNSSLNTAHSACKLSFIFDEHLTFSHQISSLFMSCYCHIRELLCIRPHLDSKTASTIAASIVHWKLDYCNSL